MSYNTSLSLNMVNDKLICELVSLLQTRDTFFFFFYTHANAIYLCLYLYINIHICLPFNTLVYYRPRSAIRMCAPRCQTIPVSTKWQDRVICSRCVRATAWTSISICCRAWCSRSRKHWIVECQRDNMRAKRTTSKTLHRRLSTTISFLKPNLIPPTPLQV